MFKKSYLVLILLINCSQPEENFNGELNTDYAKQIYPIPGFKAAIDTCVRSYSDVLLLQDLILNHARYDDILDTLVGRLIRLGSYIDQLLYSFRYEATVSTDEIEYLLKMIEYLEVTIAEQQHQTLTHGLNLLIKQCKKQLEQAVQLISYLPIIPVKLPLHQCQPLNDHYFQLA